MTESVRTLDSPPGLLTLYPRAIAGAVGGPLLRRIPGIGLPRGEDGLPATELVLEDARVERERLADYDRVCELRLRDELPATYPHLIAFPLSMQLMSDPSFPLPLLGLVHIGNRIVQKGPIALGEPLSVRVRCENLRAHPRGRQFDVLAEAAVGGEQVWEEVSTYLRRESGGERSKEGGQSATPERPAAVWSVPEDIGRRYAAVSGDRNPIHLHALSARLFGLPRAIAHGMWLKARCLGALEGELPESLSVEVAFKRPLLLPSRVEFSSWPADGGTAFAVHRAGGGEPHLEGRVGPAAR